MTTSTNRTMTSTKPSTSISTSFHAALTQPPSAERSPHAALTQFPYQLKASFTPPAAANRPHAAAHSSHAALTQPSHRCILLYTIPTPPATPHPTTSQQQRGRNAASAQPHTCHGELAGFSPQGHSNFTGIF